MFCQKLSPPGLTPGTRSPSAVSTRFQAAICWNGVWGPNGSSSAMTKESLFSSPDGAEGGLVVSLGTAEDDPRLRQVVAEDADRGSQRGCGHGQRARHRPSRRCQAGDTPLRHEWQTCRDRHVARYCDGGRILGPTAQQRSILRVYGVRCADRGPSERYGDQCGGAERFNKLDDITVEQRVYRSKEWTEVPIFNVCRKDVTIAARYCSVATGASEFLGFPMTTRSTSPGWSRAGFWQSPASAVVENTGEPGIARRRVRE